MARSARRDTVLVSPGNRCLHFAIDHRWRRERGREGGSQGRGSSWVSVRRKMRRWCGKRRGGAPLVLLLFLHLSILQGRILISAS